MYCRFQHPQQWIPLTAALTKSWLRWAAESHNDGSNGMCVLDWLSYKVCYIKTIPRLGVVIYVYIPGPWETRAFGKTEFGSCLGYIARPPSKKRNPRSGGEAQGVALTSYAWGPDFDALWSTYCSLCRVPNLNCEGFHAIYLSKLKEGICI